MTILKLGCRWDGFYPLFFDYLVQKKWVIGTTTKQYYKNGDLVLLTDGKTVLGLAKITGIPELVTDHPEIKADFIKYKIAYESWCTITNAEIYRLDKADQFWYDMRRGMCHVNDSNVKKTALNLLNEYQKNKVIMETIDILKLKNQIILQGPPGTGKTRLAKIIAAKVISGQDVTNEDEINVVLKDNEERYKIVQFHPAYSYEDFVRGIEAKANDAGTGIEYLTTNKAFLEIVELAEKSLRIPLKNDWINKKLTEFIDEIKVDLQKGNRILKDKSTFIDSISNDSIHYNQPNWGAGFEMTFATLQKNIENIPLAKGNYFPDQVGSNIAEFNIPFINEFIDFIGEDRNYKEQNKNYCIIIDEINRANLPSVLGELIYALEYRDNSVDGMYMYKGSRKISIPSNLLIIGTMNTADRSVGHIDYAIRRRFAFVDVLPSNEPMKSIANPLFKAVSELFITNYDTLNWVEPKLDRSNFVAADFRPEDIWIGHSYFITKEDGDNGKIELKLKLKYEIIPILKEYLKDGLLQDSNDQKVMDKINALYAIIS